MPSLTIRPDGDDQRHGQTGTASEDSPQTEGAPSVAQPRDLEEDARLMASQQRLLVSLGWAEQNEVAASSLTAAAEWGDVDSAPESGARW